MHGETVKYECTYFLHVWTTVVNIRKCVNLKLVDRLGPDLC